MPGRDEKDVLRDYYEEGWELFWIKYLDKDYHVSRSAYRNRMLDALAGLKEMGARTFSVLDAGCGIGIYAVNILRRYPGSSVLGVDISRKQIDHLNRWLADSPFRGRAEFRTGDVENLNISRTFDVVVCTELLEHLPDPNAALKRLVRHGHEDTRYVISVPMVYREGKSGWLSRRVVPAGWVYRKLFYPERWIDEEVRGEAAPGAVRLKYFHKEYTTEEIEDLLGCHGLRTMNKMYSNFNFRNRMANQAYSLAASYGFDKFINRLSGNRYASQITLLCRK